MHELAIEIAVKIALILSLLGLPASSHHHHVDRTPGHALPTSQGVLASPSPVAQSPASYAPAPTGASYLSAEQVASYARAAGFPESAISTMVGFAARESHFCPSAVNPGHCPGWAYVRSGGSACGLWQLYPCYGGAAWLDPMANARAAYTKWLSSGFSPWS